MVVHKSVLKRARKDEQKRLINKALKKKMKKAIKQIHKAPSKEEAQKLYPQVVSLLNRLAQKRIIHKNTARRYQSRLALFINKFSA